MAHPGGRPTKYTEALAKEICEKLSVSYKGLKQLCKDNPHWPRRETIHCWVVSNAEFSNKYHKAKEQQMDWLADEAIEIAFDNSNDSYIDQNGNRKCDNEYVNRSRLKVDTIKWYTSKLKPKKYGDTSKKDDENSPQDFLEQLVKLAKEGNHG